MDEYVNLIASAAQQNNEWSAAQAQKQMDFQERMSNTAHQREVADLKAAGLNPVLSARLGGASTPSGSMGSTDTSLTSALVDMLQLSMETSNSAARAAANSSQGDNSSKDVLEFGTNSNGTPLITIKNPDEVKQMLANVGDLMVGILTGNRKLTVEASRSVLGDFGRNIAMIGDNATSAKAQQEAVSDMYLEYDPSLVGWRPSKFASGSWFKSSHSR